MTNITSIIERWNSGEGKPYKGKLIDAEAWEKDPNIGCMCAQGQVLHLLAGWEAERLSIAEQAEADKETASLLNISRAHAVLLRNINDSVDGAPSIVRTEPAKVLGDRWNKLLDCWWHFDQMTCEQWDAAWVAARDAAAEAVAGEAARDAAGDAAWVAARDAASLVAAEAAAGDAASWVAAWSAAGAAAEIQGEAILFDQSKPLFFLPAFGWNSSADIPPRPDDYGFGVVPKEQSNDR